jgi:hypothetical protein
MQLHTTLNTMFSSTTPYTTISTSAMRCMVLSEKGLLISSQEKARPAEWSEDSAKSSFQHPCSWQMNSEPWMKISRIAAKSLVVNLLIDYKNHSKPLVLYSKKSEL